MRHAARATLVIVALLVGMLLVPNRASRLSLRPTAAQVPTPGLPDIIDPPAPLPNPTKSPPVGGGGGGSGGGGGGSGGGGAGDDNEFLPDPLDETFDRAREATGGGGSGGGAPAEKSRASGGINRGGPGVFRGLFRPSPGAWDTDKLVAIAARLRALGWSAPKIIESVYPPFIIAGPAAWTDSWGAPRYGPAPGEIRSHQGQDVFCNYGEPVLASEPGTVQFGIDTLGGLNVHLVRPEGGFWYYAHLSEWNTEELSSGDRVRPGDVIGFCGNSGDAVGTPPHVHFGWYDASGNAHDPLSNLIGWLRMAQKRAARVLLRATGERIEDIDTLTQARRFGQAFVPDTSEIGVATESLWASGASPAAGAFGLAQAALQAALAEHSYEHGYSPKTAATASAAGWLAGDQHPWSAESILSRLLQAARAGRLASGH